MDRLGQEPSSNRKGTMTNDLAKIDPPEPEQGIAPYVPPPPPSLFGTADPAEVVAKASRVAALLKDVVKQQGLISKISGKEYPRCEAWTLLGTMLGVFPVLVWTKQLENGWEARVEARTRDGAIVGAAEAQCLRAEKNWSNRDDFALRSMAQTRATAKALRMPLGFVMTLGGFQATPAEEMDFGGDQQPARTEKRANVPHGKQPDLPQEKPAKPAKATEKTRVWFLAEMRKRFSDDTLYQWACNFPQTHPYLLPGQETLEDWPLHHVPTTKRDLELMIDQCGKETGVEPTAQQPAPATDAKATESVWQGETDSGDVADVDKPQFDENGEPVESIVGKLEAVSVKEGTSKKGPWKRFGLKVGDEWFNTFSATLGKCAEADKGHTVRIQFRRGEKGNDLVSIERAKA